MSNLNNRSHVPRWVPPRAVFPRAAGIIDVPSPWVDMGDWIVELNAFSPDFTVGGYNYSCGVDGSELVLITVGLNAWRYDPAANTYSGPYSDGGVLTNHPDGAGAQVGNIIYIIGGFIGGGDSNKVTGFDVSSNTWAAYADYPQGVTGNLAAASGGKAYSFGGGLAGFTPNGGDAFVYDPGSNTWSAITSVPTDIFGFGFAVTLDDDTILVYGATGGGSAGGYIYDPGGDSYTAIAPGPRGGASPFYYSAVVIDGIVYASTNGGLSGNESFADAYDPTTDTWTESTQAVPWRNPMDSVSGPRHAASAATVDGVGWFPWDRNDTYSHMLRFTP